MSLVPVADKVQPGWLNKKSMADSLGISVQAYDKWGVQPIARVGRSVYYTVQSVVQNRLENEASKRQPEPDPTDLGSGYDYERYRLTKAQADAQEHKNEIAQQQAVPVEFATYALAKISAEACGILDSAPLDLKRKHPEFSTVQIENIKRSIAKSSSAIARLPEKLPDLLDEYLRETDS